MTLIQFARFLAHYGMKFAFEYLRIVERDGGLVYIALPGGKTPTEFVLSELSPTRAVFDPCTCSCVLTRMWPAGGRIPKWLRVGFDYFRRVGLIESP
ncbi:MAG: hypothetical protein ABL921_15090 [Pirellula sp.]